MAWPLGEVGQLQWNVAVRGSAVPRNVPRRVDIAVAPGSDRPIALHLQTC